MAIRVGGGREWGRIGERGGGGDEVAGGTERFKDGDGLPVSVNMVSVGPSPPPPAPPLRPPPPLCGGHVNAPRLLFQQLLIKYPRFTFLPSMRAESLRAPVQPRRKINPSRTRKQESVLKESEAIT